jgi:hypothetical protein
MFARHLWTFSDFLMRQQIYYLFKLAQSFVFQVLTTTRIKAGRKFAHCYCKGISTRLIFGASNRCHKFHNHTTMGIGELLTCLLA